MKLKTILILIFVVLTIIPVVSLGLFTMNYYQSKMEDVLRNDLTVAAQTQVEAIHNFLHERDISISIISETLSVRDLLLSNTATIRDKYYVDDLLDTRIRRNEYILSASLVDMNYKIVASSVPNSENTISGLKNINPEFLDGELHFSSVIEADYIPERQEQKVIIAIKGVWDKQKLIGYIVEEIGLNFFDQVRNSATLFNDGTIYITDGDKNLISAGKTNESRKEYVLSKEEQADYLRAWNARDIDADSGHLEYRARGELYFSYYSKIPDTNWQLMASVNADQILQTKSNMFRLFVMLAAILLLLSLSIRIMINSKIAKPLDNIISKFNLINKTQDYSIRMESPKSKEIDEISRGINALLEDVQTNIDREVQKQKRLREKASTDALTGLYNKRAMEEILCSALDASSLQNGNICCLFIDIDNFKQFNTLYGHQGGDKVICFVADTLKQLFPNVGRMGGDEFAVCLNEVNSPEHARQLTETLLKTLAQGIEVNGSHVVIHCSIGVIFSKCEMHSYEELLHKADEAMYNVKNTSKNNYCIVEI